MEAVQFKCGCDGEVYSYTYQEAITHFRSKVHQDWIKRDSANLHDNIKIVCPCGGEDFSYYSQMLHLKTARHKLWQNIGDRKYTMPFICGCSLIVPYNLLTAHRGSEDHVIPDFEILRRGVHS